MSKVYTFIIADILGKSSAILHSDGLVVFEKIKQAKDEDISISFKGIEYCTTAFLNASVGKYIVDTKGAKTINYIDVSEDIQNKITLVEENVRNEKKRNSLDDSSRGFLFA